MEVGTFAEYLTTVLGYTILILVALGYFIFVLFQGLNTKDALIIDHKPVTNEHVAQTKH